MKRHILVLAALAAFVAAPATLAEADPAASVKADIANHKLDVEDFAAGAEFLSTYELGERLHGLDSDLPGGNGDHRQRGRDERGGRRIRVARDRQICGDVDPSRPRLL